MFTVYSKVKKQPLEKLIYIEPPGENTQRIVVLLSKVLQSIANGTLPGKKEGYMESMNDFISTHIKDAEKFFERISEVTPESHVDFDKYEVPENAYTNSLLFLQKHMNQVSNKINAALDETTRGEELKPKLKDALGQE